MVYPRYLKFALWIVVLLFVSLLAACGGNADADEGADNASIPAATKSSVTTSAASAAVTTADGVTTTAAVTSNASAAPTASGGERTFTISQAGTEARFSIYEQLMGQDKTVVGVTPLVDGAITVDPANPSRATVSPIRIDASDLTTDSDRRNGAIRRFILESSQEAYKYITFTPTAIEGLPVSVNVGDTFSFTVQGDLTIRDVTNPATFELTVTANAANELVGLGKAIVTRSDYGLTIPSVPSVANVGEEVQLEIEFTAIATG